MLMKKVTNSFRLKLLKGFNSLDVIGKAKALVSLCFESLIYGILLSFIFAMFLKTPFDLKFILAFSVVWYFISNELPYVFNKYRGSN